MTNLTSSQRLAVESIDSHVLVSAGAGSGKTHVLVERYIEILKQNPAVNCANLLAVTYTKKAASEMRTRLKTRIQQLLEASSGKEISRWSSLRAEIDTAKIGTIHSLCESILKTFPAEAAIDPAFEVLDDLERAELLQLSIEETIQTLGVSDETIHAFLSTYYLEDIQKIIAKLIDQRLQFQEIIEQFESLSDYDLNSHFVPLLDYVQASAIAEVTGQKIWLDNLEFLRNNPFEKKASKPGAPGLNDYRLQLIACADTSMETTKDVGTRFGALNDLLNVSPRTTGGNEELAKALRAAIREIKELTKDYIGSLPVCLGEIDSAAYTGIRCITKLTQTAISLYEKHKQQRLDYNDLIWLTRCLVEKQNSACRRYFNHTLHTILVDEFQDTNLMQSQLLAQLAGTNTRLFFIGDDKQSIYKFQGADVSIFNNWRNSLSNDHSSTPLVKLDGPRHTVSLQDSFRSHPQLVNFVNSIFSQLFKPGNHPQSYAAKHAALTAYRSDSAADTRVDVNIFDAHDNDGQRQGSAARDTEASAIANWISGKISEGAPVFEKHSGLMRPIVFGDFAILVQRNSDFAAIESALAAIDIPYVTHAGSGFLQRQEIYDLENCLRFLFCPEDSHALIGILRSPLFSIADDIIFALFQGQSNSLWKIITQESNLQNYPSLKSAVFRLKTLIADCKTHSLADTVRSIITATNYDITLMGLPNGRQRSRNVWKFVWFCHQHNEKTLTDFIASLNIMRQLNVKNSDAPVDCPDAVKLMTIHASKGLEFPAVILPVLSTSANDVNGKFLMHPAYGLAFDTTRTKDEAKPASFAIARYMEKDMQVAEKKRLFYVAMTRARDYLALFVERGPKGRVSFRAWLNEILGIDQGDELTKDGTKLVTVNGQAASYSVHNLDRQIIASKRTEILAQQAPTNEDKDKEISRLDFSLLEADVKSTPRKLTCDWQKTLRVTKHKEKLDAATVGIFFHSAIERLASKDEMPADGDLINIARLGEFRISDIHMRDELIAKAKSLLSKFYTSELFRLIAGAKSVFYETSYMMALPDNSKHDEKRTDLILQDTDNHWHVIDFKTDHFEIHDLEKKVSEHKKQIQQYVDDLELIAGVKFKGQLYFAEHALLTAID